MTDPVLRYRTMGQWTDPVTDDRQATSRFRGKVDQYDSASGTMRKVTRNPTIGQIEAGLLVEARAVDASDVIVELDLPSTAFYVDGTGVKGNARTPEFPGVVVHLIGTRFGDLRYSCDAFDCLWSGEPPGWHGNLRAIVRTLEALRLVERYGTARRGEQYAGWSALPPGTPMGTGSATEVTMTLDEAARFLAGAGAVDGLEPADVLEEVSDARTAYRLASKRLHPDNLHTGSHEAFLRLEAAWQMLREHHAD
jgi:hypothetical protein